MRRQTSTNRLEKKLKKPLDKIQNLWYNKATMKEKENS